MHQGFITNGHIISLLIRTQIIYPQIIYYITLPWKNQWIYFELWTSGNFSEVFSFSFVQNRSFYPVGTGKRKNLQNRLAKWRFLSSGYWREKSFRIFWSKRMLMTGGKWEVKIFGFFRANGNFCQGGTGEKKFQIFLARQPISLQWVVGEKSFRKSGPLHRFPSREYWTKKISKTFVQNRQNPPVGIGERKFSETVSFASLPRLPVEGQKFSSKISGQNGLS